jgi:hypothetical protein
VEESDSAEGVSGVRIPRNPAATEIACTTHERAISWVPSGVNSIRRRQFVNVGADEGRLADGYFDR